MSQSRYISHEARLVYAHISGLCPIPDAIGFQRRMSDFRRMHSFRTSERAPGDEWLSSIDFGGPPATGLRCRLKADLLFI